jgi:peptidoglycan/LPS O-acetylase OafA/YrhL
MDKHMWFIYSLFFVFVVSYPLHKKLMSKTGLIILTFLYFLTQLLPVPDLLENTVYLLLYFTIGRHMSWIRFLAETKRFVLFTSAFVILFAFDQFEMIHNIKLLHVSLSILMAILGCAVILSISKYLVESRVCNILNIYSYDIYLIHQPFLVSGVVGMLLVATSFPYPIICVVALVTGIAVPIIVSKFILRKVKLFRFIFLGASFKKYAD